MITIEPAAGLCNRMRALDSVLALGRAVGSSVAVLWPLDDSCYCPIDMLFEPLPGVVRVLSHEAAEDALRMEGLARLSPTLSRAVVRVRKSKRLRGARRRIRNWDAGIWTLNQRDTVYYTSRPEKLIRLAARHDLYIDTFERFFRGPTNFEGFRPVAAIRDRVARFGLDSRAIGVHVRRTDNDNSRRFSPIEGFIEKMQAAIEEDASTTFYLASDSLDVAAFMEREFPGRIARQTDKNYARSEAAGIQQALVDLYCLSSCRRIIGSFGSSFTDVASEIGRIPLDVVYRSDGKEVGL